MPFLDKVRKISCTKNYFPVILVQSQIHYGLSLPLRTLFLDHLPPCNNATPSKYEVQIGGDYYHSSGGIILIRGDQGKTKPMDDPIEKCHNNCAFATLWSIMINQSLYLIHLDIQDDFLGLGLEREVM